LVCRPWSWSLETMFLVSRPHWDHKLAVLVLSPLEWTVDHLTSIPIVWSQVWPATAWLLQQPASFFYRLDALPVAQPTVSKHWRETTQHFNSILISTAFWHRCIVQKQAASMVWNICWLQKPSRQKHTIMIFIRARTEPKILDSNWVCSGSE